MKKLILFPLLFLLITCSIFGQQPVDANGNLIDRCNTMEAHAALLEKYPEHETLDEFEEWLAPLVRQYKEEAALNGGRAMVVTNIPVVFHIIHDNDPIGSGDNIDASLIDAQIEQLNNDFRRIMGTSGDNNDPNGADAELEFCLAFVDPNGNNMAEAGINRINRNTQGWPAPPYGTCDFRGDLVNTQIEQDIKPVSQWDPSNYLNIWVMPLSCGTLGYAQFPNSSGLDGFDPANELNANTDGVVIIPSSVGSSTNPNPAGGAFSEGRTATHELGHFFGLLHVWQGGCGQDDFCADTPESDAPNFGCVTGHVSCGTVDMVENYMDYSDDACMNIFTEDQKARMQTVLAESPRRGDLGQSTVCENNCPNPCASTITSFPYNESFESGLGAWVQGTDDNLNWTRDANGTPSTGTGPNSAFDGSWYLFTEASSGNSNRTAHLYSPCFELSTLNNPQFSFAYHMLGNNMGSLSVDLTTNCGTSWTTVWSRSGQQNNDQNTWNVAGIPLNNFIGQNVQLRFRGLTGNGWSSDVTIDDVSLEEACSITINAPYPVLFDPDGQTQSFSVSSTSLWTQTSTEPWLSATPASGVFSITVTAQPNPTTDTRIGYINVTCGGTTRQIFVVQDGQEPEPVSCNSTIYAFPYNESFETSIGQWTQDPDDSNMDWTRDANGTPSLNTGPSAGSCGNFYMFTEATGFSNRTTSLISPCFNLDGASGATFNFDYHMFGSNMGTLRLELSTNSGQTYSTIWSRTGQQSTTQGNAGWISESIALDNFINQTIRLRFRGTTGNSFRSDMAIDCINLTTEQGCPDQYEANNTYQTAHFVGFPGSTNISVPDICLTTGDNDYFEFLNSDFSRRYVRVRGVNNAVGDYQLSIQITNFTNFKRYTIETLPQNGSSTNTYLYLYNSNGTSQLAADDNAGPGLFSRIVYDDFNFHDGGIDPNTLTQSGGANLALTNYPNPFTDQTVISFNLPETSTVTLTVYDTHGKVIAQPIVKENRNEGVHTHEFDGSQLPDGVYMYSLQTEHQIVSKQMVIIR